MATGSGDRRAHEPRNAAPREQRGQCSRSQASYVPDSSGPPPTIGNAPQHSVPKAHLVPTPGAVSDGGLLRPDYCPTGFGSEPK